MAGTLLLVHGFPLDGRMWGELASAATGVDRVLNPSLAGHAGGAAAAPATTVDGMARELAGLLDAEGVDAVHLGGFSMGGYVCFAFWRLFPERVRSLLFVDTRAGADSEEGKQGRDALAARVRAEGASAAADAMVPKLLSEAAPEEMRDQVRGWVMEQPVEAVVADLQALRDRPDSRADLAGIGVPALVVCGSADVLTPPAESELMASSIPGAELVMIERAGHLSPVEQSGAVAGAISGFLSRL